MEIKDVKRLAGISENKAVSLSTVANLNAFLEDLAKKLRTGEKVNIQVQLKGANVLQYSFTACE